MVSLFECERPSKNMKTTTEATHITGTHTTSVTLLLRMRSSSLIPAARADRSTRAAGEFPNGYPAAASAGTRFAAFGVPSPVTASQPVLAENPGIPVPACTLSPTVTSNMSVPYDDVLAIW